jgi:hypothetical protein
LASSCSPALYLPTQTDALQAGSSIDNLMSGRTLYVKNCGSCHNVHLPEQFTRAQWKVILPEMQRKAKISDEETKLISAFIMARCKPE